MQPCGLAEAFLNSAGRQYEASGGDLHNLPYEKDNLLSSSLVLFTFIPVHNANNNQEEDVNPQRKDA